jgi:glyoxylase I family protein
MQASNKASAKQGAVNQPILIRQVSHTATRVLDMAATRDFYEGLLGLPMVITMLADFDVVTQAPSNYIHCFFELSDGSAIAFFQFEGGYRGPMHPRNSDPYERHIALRVEEKETVNAFAAKAEKAGVKHFIVDHDDFYSLYLTDPDGEQVEVTWHKPSYAGLLNRDVASKTLEEWLAKARK